MAQENVPRDVFSYEACGGFAAKIIYIRWVDTFMNRPYIISISAVAGGGKTSVTKALSGNLNRATAFYFDNYEYTKQPDNISEWVDNGANSDAWDLFFIENDISVAIQSNKFDYIIIDYPFGKK